MEVVGSQGLSLPSETLGRVILFAPSGVIKVNTSSWFLARREKSVTCAVWRVGQRSRARTRVQDGGLGVWLPLEAGVDEGLSGTSSPDPRSGATSLRIWVWGKQEAWGTPKSSRVPEPQPSLHS